MATELEATLLKLKLQSYLPQLLFAGFYDWHSLSKITESDFAALGVLRGHRRELQRAIARSGGWSDIHPLPTIIDHSQIRDGTVKVRAVSLSSRSMYSSSNTSGSPASAFKTASSPDTELENDSNILAPLQLRILFLQCIRDHAEDSGRMAYDYSSTSKADVDKDTKSLLLQATDRNALEPRMTPSYQSANHDISDRNADSFLALVAEVRKAFLSPSCGSAYHGVNTHYSDPSSGYSIPTLTSYLEAFLGKLNNYLYLFNESDLRMSFQDFVLGNSCLHDSGSVAELYLMLALGAKLSSPNFTTVHLGLYARSSNCLAIGKWGKNLWVMRMLALLSFCHCDDVYGIDDQSYHYLNLALRVGKAIGLDEQELPLAALDEPERSHWLRVWNSLRFLHSWYQVCGRGTPISLFRHDSFIDTMNPPISTDDEYESRVVQMSVLFIGSLFREAATDFTKTPNPSPAIYNTYLYTLRQWYAGLPQSLCTTPGNHMYIEAAESLLKLCTTLAESGMTLYGNAITSYFLFNATLILLLDTCRTHKSDPSLQSDEQPRSQLLQNRIDVIWGARDLLDDCVGVKGSPQSQIVETFCKSWDLI